LNLFFDNDAARMQFQYECDFEVKKRMFYQRKDTVNVTYQAKKNHSKHEVCKTES